MSKKLPNPELIDQDNPEWTESEVKTSLRLGNLPLSLQRKFRGQRGPQKMPRKVQTSVRYDVEVVQAFKAGGPGWQTRMNDALRDWLKTHGA